MYAVPRPHLAPDLKNLYLNAQFNVDVDTLFTTMFGDDTEFLDKVIAVNDGYGEYWPTKKGIFLGFSTAGAKIQNGTVFALVIEIKKCSRIKAFSNSEVNKSEVKTVKYKDTNSLTPPPWTPPISLEQKGYGMI